MSRKMSSILFLAFLVAGSVEARPLVRPSGDLPGGVAAEGVAGLEATPSGLRAVTGESVLGTLAGLPDGAAFTPAGAL